MAPRGIPSLQPTPVSPEVWGSSQAFSFDLDQPLFLVSWMLELPGKDGSEGDILSSLVGKQLGIPVKPGKDKISKCNGIWKWMGKLMEIRGRKRHGRGL